MSSRLKALIIRVVLAGACALAAATTVAATEVATTAGPTTAEAAVTSDAAPARSPALGGNDPIGVTIDAIVLNFLTS